MDEQCRCQASRRHGFRITHWTETRILGRSVERSFEEKGESILYDTSLYQKRFSSLTAPKWILPRFGNSRNVRLTAQVAPHTLGSSFKKSVSFRNLSGFFLMAASIFRSSASSSRSSSSRYSSMSK